MLAVVSPLGLVYNAVNSVLFLGEQITTRICIATGIIMMGSFLSIASGKRSDSLG